MLGSIIHGTQLIGPLEHDMLKVMGDSCVRTVHRTGIDHHRTKHLGLAVIHVEPHLHAIAQFQFLNLQR